MPATGAGSAALPPRPRPSRPRLDAQLRPAGLPEDDFVDEAYLHGLDFGAADLSGRVARLIEVEGCRLNGTALSGSRLERTTLVDVAFERCDLANVVLNQSSLTRVTVIGCRATGLVASGCLLRHVTFRDCLLDLSVFRFARLERVELVDCRLHGADLVAADLRGGLLRRCDLEGAELSQVQAKGALLVDCTWDGVRGVSSLAGATVVTSSPLDADAFMVATAGSLGIRLGDPADYPDPD